MRPCYIAPDPDVFPAGARVHPCAPDTGPDPRGIAYRCRWAECPGSLGFSGSHTYPGSRVRCPECHDVREGLENPDYDPDHDPEQTESTRPHYEIPGRCWTSQRTACGAYPNLCDAPWQRPNDCCGRAP